MGKNDLLSKELGETGGLSTYSRQDRRVALEERGAPRTTKGKSRRPSLNPYCSFHDDRERRLALISRDVRLVMIALFTVLSAPGVAQLLRALL